MAKVKISDGEKEIVGVVKTILVKPFGAGSHVVLSKVHRGKNIEIIIPDDAKYSWTMDDSELNEIISACELVLKYEKDTKLKSLKREKVFNLSKPYFKYDDLVKTVELLKTRPEFHKLVTKLEKAYNIESPKRTIKIKQE